MRRTGTARCASCSSSSCSRSRACSRSISSRRRTPRAAVARSRASSGAAKPAPETVEVAFVRNGWVVRVRARRSQGRGAGRGRAAGAHPGADEGRAAHRASGRRCPRARACARCAPTPTTWFASFSRSTLGRGSAETKRMRLWQIAATLAPHGEKELAARRDRRSLRDDAPPRRPPRTVARRDGRERLPLRRRAACSSGSLALGYLDRRDVTGVGRLPHRAGAPRVPGLGGPRPHGHGDRADAARALPRVATEARRAPARKARSRSTATSASCSWSRTARSCAPCTRPRAPGGVTPVGDVPACTRRCCYSWSVPFQVWMPYAAYFRGGIATHQSPDVPSYPASHGCVRLPEGEAERVYRFVDVGTPVAVR